jgi:hypothetical protein
MPQARHRTPRGAPTEEEALKGEIAFLFIPNACHQHLISWPAKNLPGRNSLKAR